jgi:hypothetical protein
MEGNKYELSQKDIIKVKNTPYIETKISYLPDKKLWVMKRIETTFLNDNYLNSIKNSAEDKAKSNFDSAIKYKKTNFDDIE